ncbi:hypothetical protein [Roseococcus microcysteis]|uniref:hypothetical protein n=1 Tax=Roseococcus microcysteis TaxID=2771361 RepID=UPI00168B6D2F|nr:hypothetical protein [Roseococcus microcysteis]
MSNRSATATMSVLTGSITSIAIALSDELIPNANLKSLFAVTIGIISSIIVYEILSWMTYFKLLRRKNMIAKIIPQIQQIDSVLRHEILSSLNAARSHAPDSNQTREIETAVVRCSTNLAVALSEIQNEAVKLLRDLAD